MVNGENVLKLERSAWICCILEEGSGSRTSSLESFPCQPLNMENDNRGECSTIKMLPHRTEQYIVANQYEVDSVIINAVISRSLM